MVYCENRSACKMFGNVLFASSQAGKILFYSISLCKHVKVQRGVQITTTASSTAKISTVE